jgi:hypothetical protein
MSGAVLMYSWKTRSEADTSGAERACGSRATSKRAGCLSCSRARAAGRGRADGQRREDRRGIHTPFPAQAAVSLGILVFPAFKYHIPPLYGVAVFQRSFYTCVCELGEGNEGAVAQTAETVLKTLCEADRVYVCDTNIWPCIKGREEVDLVTSSRTRDQTVCEQGRMR